MCKITPFLIHESGELNSANLFFCGPDVKVILNSLRENLINFGVQERFNLIYLDLPIFLSHETIFQLENQTMDSSKNLEKLLLKLPREKPAEIFWKGPLDDYFENLKAIMSIAIELLCDDGFMVVKAVGRHRHYIKILLDDLLSIDRFVNEVLYYTPFSMKSNTSGENGFFEITGSLLIYSLNQSPKIFPTFKDKSSGGYWHTMHSKGQGPARIFKFNGKEYKIEPPIGRHWTFNQDRINEMCDKGFIRLNKEDKPVYWVIPKQGHILDNNWLDIESFAVGSFGFESSENILARLLKSFTKKDDCFLHIFGGSGIGANIAIKNKRRYVGIDSRRAAIDLHQKAFQKETPDYFLYSFE